MRILVRRLQRNKISFMNLSLNAKSAIEKFRSIKSLQIEDTYPNVEVALRMFFSIPISDCSGEESFSMQ
ncbi:hypothetical protein JTE90_029512 [Oedothorax gibbosus]|uniref:HAT C-terminal dimerisation domain-containing protein n=1 Tax=Oedothorax gibbosus TaxID=931172 RepID=A0AAV6UG45_9ARAC|nr:hypothetical protein JTE90_029512 [Oedothorax gibbosus]